MQRLTSKIKAIPGAATQRVEDVVLLTRALISQTIILIISFYLLFLLATFIYGSFYFAFVPAPIHQGPVHLIFEPCQEKIGKCGFLNASVVLSDRNPILMTGKLIIIYINAFLLRAHSLHTHTVSKMVHQLFVMYFRKRKKNRQNGRNSDLSK